MDDDDSIPDECDDDDERVPACVAPGASASLPAIAASPAIARVFEAWKPESLYDFLAGSSVAGAGAREPRQRAAIVHKRALREEPETEGEDAKRWDERAARAKREHIPQLPCKFFNSARGCQVVNCAFEHVKGSASKQTCKFWRTGSCMHGVRCTFLHE